MSVHSTHQRTITKLINIIRVTMNITHVAINKPVLQWTIAMYQPCTYFITWIIDVLFDWTATDVAINKSTRHMSGRKVLRLQPWRRFSLAVPVHVHCCLVTLFLYLYTDFILMRYVTFFFCILCQCLILDKGSFVRYVLCLRKM